jgi:cytochrome c peroxidase
VRSQPARRLSVVRVAALVCATVAALATGAPTLANEPAVGPSDLAVLKAEYRRPAAIPYPDDNPHSAARERLGRALFFDPRLSGSRWMSCASCHNPGLAWGDGLPRALGNRMDALPRRTPTILDVAWGASFFWDGRADTLEAQALAPIAAAAEMNLPLDEMVARLEAIAGYRELFARAYPNEPISAATVGKALATFERSVVSGVAPFDRWVEGDAAAIPVPARRGFVLFNGKARCSTCHTGWRFTDEGFYDIGVDDGDVGRGAVMPRITLAQFAFKTPTLRDVARRAPYLHNGSAATLEDVIELYDRGGQVARPSLAAPIAPLRLTAAEKSDLVAFLKTLTSPIVEVRVPVLPR